MLLRVTDVSLLSLPTFEPGCFLLKSNSPYYPGPGAPSFLGVLDLPGILKTISLANSRIKRLFGLRFWIILTRACFSEEFFLIIISF
jgi:hypothetical protein